MRDTGLTQLLSSLLVAHTEGVASTPQTPECVSLARFRTALLRENWTPDEQIHLTSCALCRHRLAQNQPLLFHPPLSQLLHSLRTTNFDTDLDYHLRHDHCQRCERLLGLLRGGTLLARLGTQALELALRTAEVLPLPFPRFEHTSFTLEGEQLVARILLHDKVTLRLQWRQRSTTETVYLTGAGLGEQFVPVYPETSHPDAVSLRLAELPEVGELIIVPAEPLLILPEARSNWMVNSTRRQAE